MRITQNPFPFITYKKLSDVAAYLKTQPKPLALYLFSRNKKNQNYIIEHTSSGGVTINDVMLHGATRNLPYGGVGESGMGAYHGKTTFDTFTHYKSVLKKSFLIDFAIRYAPYKGKFKALKLFAKLTNR